ncbi:hypothetical protein ACWEIM_30610 [Streptomyces sp. NPDC004778]
MVQTTLRSVPVADLRERADARQELVGRDCLLGCLRERCRVDQGVDADEHDDQADRLIAEDLRRKAASGRGTEGGLGISLANKDGEDFENAADDGVFRGF